MTAQLTSPPATPPAPQPPPTTSPSRPAWRPGVPLLGLLTAWVALFAWSGMVADPLTFLVPTLVLGLLVVLAGTLLRLLPLEWYAVAGVQLVLALLLLNLSFGGKQSLLRIIPTPASVREVVDVIDNGARTLNHYVSPVALNPGDTRALLVACGLAVILAVDVLAVGLRRAPLVAIPILIALSIPISVLKDSLALPVYIGTALLFLRLLATEHLERYGRWGRPASSREKPPPRPVITLLWEVSIIAVVVSLLVAPLVPMADLLHRNQGLGAGNGSGYQLTAVNPFIRLRRDLVEQTHTPMVFAETSSLSTSYIRTTVLDEFTSEEWRPSPRNLPTENSADGAFPNPPGLAAGAPGITAPWKFQFASSFVSTWLPLPYPIRDLKVPGSWRFDSRTLDVAYVGGGSPPGLEYSATAFTPTIDARQLEAAVGAPTKLRKAMTAVPADLPKVITTRAKEVTRGATTNFEKAVALQNWFRQDGGFTYSLDQRGGSGMDLLADFVTNDRIGYCEQFAAAMAAMGRVLGIPSRVVVGFLNGTQMPDGRIVYTSDDRHAWPEMYFTGVGWVRFEPTPAQRAGATPPYTRQDLSAPTTTQAPATAPTPRAATKPDASQENTSTTTKHGVSIPWWPVVVLVLVLLIGAIPALVRAAQRRRRLSGHDPGRLAEGAWAELRASALDLGLDWPDRGSPREQARRLVDQVGAGGETGSLDELLVRVERRRYASGGVVTLERDARARTLETVEEWRRRMLAGVDRGPALRARLWPVSLVRPRNRA